MDSEAVREFKEGAGPGALWAGILAGPLAALVQLQANYALVLWVCGSGGAWALHAVSAAALLVAFGAGLFSWRNWQKAGADWDDEGAGVLPRSRFMAAVGMLISAHSSLVIIAQWIAVFVYSACQRS